MECKHDIKHEIITNDGEIVCRMCGIVKEHTQNMIVHGENQINLYLMQTLGSKNDPKLYGNRFICEQNPDLAVISNITEKLYITSITSRDIWKWYQKLRANLKMTKAKILVLVFYVVCRAHGHPINEQKLHDAIRMNLNVKRVYNYLKVSMEASSYLDKNGNMIIKKIGFLDMVPSLTNHHHNNNASFILNSEIATLHNNYPEHIVNEVANNAKSIIPTLQNYSSAHAVKLAIKLAKEQCGITSCGKNIINYDQRGKLA